MHLDALDLRTFYYRTRLGRAAQRAIREQLLALWPDAPNETVVGFGFAVPLLRPYLKSARRVIGLMPGQQGVMPWPPGAPNLSVLCEERLWPLQTGFVDRLIVLHGIETTEDPAGVLDECHRVLGPNGKAMFIVPNRGGLWARRDGTPFGFGRPYSLSQIESQLAKHGFVPERHAAALYQPPSDSRFWMRAGPMSERIGQRISGRFAGGVLLAEASKEPTARPSGGVKERATRPLRVLDGLPQPAPGSAARNGAARLRRG